MVRLLYNFCKKAEIKSKFRGILKTFVCFQGKLDFLRFVGY